jgi:hypothetical protein
MLQLCSMGRLMMAVLLQSLLGSDDPNECWFDVEHARLWVGRLGLILLVETLLWHVRIASAWWGIMNIPPLHVC